MNNRCVFALAIFIAISGTLVPGLSIADPALADAPPWKRHTIDDSSRGADGVRLADANGDGLLDIATAWEEGGIVRVYLNPGPKKAKQKWPAVTVGEVKSGEDAVLVDLDGDGAMDVVSSCEGRTKTMYVHWAPKDKTKYLDPTAWKTEAIPATQGKQMWMFCLPMDIDGKHGIDLVVGSKGGGATVGWLESPKNPRDLKAWKFHKLRDAGWIMSLVAHDMNEDGNMDVVLSDRKGKKRGVYWLTHPGREAVGKGMPWKVEYVGGNDKEVMFMSVFPRERRHPLIHVATLEQKALVFVYTLPPDAGKPDGDNESLGFWFPVKLTFNLPKSLQRMKAVRRGDIDLDGRKNDVVFTFEGANNGIPGVYWMSIGKKENDNVVWDVAGPKGVKFDRIELIDLDGDGDLDVLTCEERDQLGVIWYENPTK